MSRISPFTGLLFDRSRVGPLERVTTPPYDTITLDEQRRFRESSPFNIVRLVLGEDRPGDDADNNKYRRGAAHLRRWRDEGVLSLSERPAYFAYEMRFTLRGESRRVMGVICQVELEPWGGSIIPHEHTMEGPIEDRLLLLRAVRANLSALYALFSGPCRPLGRLLDEVSSEAPHLEMTDEAGVNHRLWILDDRDDVGRWLAGEELLIADGHHRYSTALRYQGEMRSRVGPGPWDRVMMLVVDAAMEDPPVLPIHRVLSSGAAPSGGARVSGLAEVLASVSDQRLLYGTLAWENGGLVHRVHGLRGPPPAVCALHREVLDDLAPEGALDFTPDAAAAEERVRTHRAEAAYFLPATTADRIRAVIDRGELLPRKSTFFWPKPRTGMVIRPFE